MAFVFSACGADSFIGSLTSSDPSSDATTVSSLMGGSGKKKPLALIPSSPSYTSTTTTKNNNNKSTMSNIKLSPARSSTTATTATMTTAASSTVSSFATTTSSTNIMVAAALANATAVADDDPLRCGVEILKDRLYYMAYKNGPPTSLHNINTNGRNNHSKSNSTTTAPIIDPSMLVRNGKPIYFFSIDRELLYWNFFLDFGPLNLGQLYRFSRRLNTLLNKKPNHVICYYSSSEYAKRANARFLICAWQILFLQRTPEEALKGFHRPTDDEQNDFIKNNNGNNKSNNNSYSSFVGDNYSPLSDASSSSSISVNTNNEAEESTRRTIHNNNASKPPKANNSLSIHPLKPFHDASPCICSYDLTVLDCLRGLVKARMYGFFDFKTFDVQEYEHFEQVENGDLNWIIKDRILAFAGPHYRRNVSREGYCTLTPDDYIPYFKEKKVSMVIRLNKKCYEETDFTEVGVNHFEQYYLDGSCPPYSILQNVLQAMESVPPDEAFAIHCKAGLGRTGTCIGAYMMKHYKFSAAEAIGWMRICRPGMVIGPQQHFLQELEQQLWQEGTALTKSPFFLPTRSVMDTPVSCTRTTTTADNNTITSSTKICMVNNNSNSTPSSKKKDHNNEGKKKSPTSVIAANLPQYVVTSTTKTSNGTAETATNEILVDDESSGQAAQLLQSRRNHQRR